MTYPDMEISIAAHEAAHAAAAWLSKLQVLRVSIEPEGGTFGHVSVEPLPSAWEVFHSGDAGHDERMVRTSVMHLMGPYLGSQWLAKDDHHGAGSDWRNTVELRQRVLVPAPKERFWQEVGSRVEAMVERQGFRRLHHAFTEALLRRGCLAAWQAHQVIKSVRA